MMKNVRRKALALALMGGLCLPSIVLSQADLYIRDDENDAGAEPNTTAVRFWESPDIWVRQEDDGGTTHQNPEYRNPMTGKPNYIYVRIKNRGNQASTGGEELKLYWSKASTKLDWPTNWKDYLEPRCNYSGHSAYYGNEITNPPVRRNLAYVSEAERTKLVNAILELRNSYYEDENGMPYPVNKWFNQDQIHAYLMMITENSVNRNYIHSTPLFLPWHREFINMLEISLRQIDPTVTLHYWDWSIDAEQTYNGIPSIFTSDFMGTPYFFGDHDSDPFTPDVQMPDDAGDPLVTNSNLTPMDRLYDPNLTANNTHREKVTPIVPGDIMNWNYELPPNHMTRDYDFDRRLSLPNQAADISDATILAYGDIQPANYPNPGSPTPQNGQYARFCNAFNGRAHQFGHFILGGDVAPMSTTFRDPLAFFLHSNVDRLFAKWQRNPLNPWRMNPNEIYGVETETIGQDTYDYYPVPQGAMQQYFYDDIDPYLNKTMRPWNGLGMSGMPLEPFEGNFTFAKTPRDKSIVTPPFYEDTDKFYNVDLSNNGIHDFNSISIKVPPVPANGEIIVSYPWYPPNPEDYTCDADNTHFCLLARIVNPTLSNEGMTTPEGADTPLNAKNNNNIVQKNITILDIIPGIVKEKCVIIRNRNVIGAYFNFNIEAVAKDVSVSPTGYNPFDSVIVEVEPGVYQRWIAGGAVSSGVTDIGNNRFKLSDSVLTHPGIIASIDSVKLDSGARRNVCFTFYLKSQLDSLKFNDVIFTQKDSNYVLQGGETFSYEYDGGSLQRARPEEPVKGNRVAPTPLNFSLTPNPADNYVEVQSKAQEECTVRIINLLGQEVFSGRFTGNLKINTSNLVKGSYIVEVKGQYTQSFSTQNLIIQ